MTLFIKLTDSFKKKIMENIFYGNWQSLVRTFILTILIYIVVVIFLKAFGKRTLSKMNAFDFIVTIALGSCLPTVALNKKCYTRRRSAGNPFVCIITIFYY